jgi:hypothetical protein
VTARLAPLSGALRYGANRGSRGKIITAVPGPAVVADLESLATP